MAWTIKRLKEIATRDKCTFKYKTFGDLKRETKINFVCNCGEDGCKAFRMLWENGGGFCKSCTSKNMVKKVRDTTLETTGYDNASKNPTIKEKKKATIVKHYGVTHQMLVAEVKEKIKQTCIKNLGVSHPSQSEQIKQKKVKTCMKHFGVEYAGQSKVVKDKMKATNQKNYGVDCVLSSGLIRQKIRHTMVEKYGCEYALQSDKIIEKRKKTCIDKYGVEYTLQSEQIKEKIKTTCIDKYGVDAIGKSDIVKSKIIATTQKKYGVDCVLSSPYIKQKIKQTIKDILLKNPLRTVEITEKRRKTCIDKYGVDYPMQDAKVADYSSKQAWKHKIYTLPSGKDIIIQGYENRVLDVLVKFIPENNIVTRRSLVPEVWYSMNDGKYHRYFVDIYIPSLNTVIEIKSTWTIKKDGISLHYKRKACEYLGYRFVLFVFDKKTLLNHTDIKTTLIEK